MPGFPPPGAWDHGAARAIARTQLAVTQCIRGQTADVVTLLAGGLALDGVLGVDEHKGFEPCFP
jgi:hypothetical protein